MTDSFLLKQFEYSIPVSALSLNEAKHEYLVSENLPLLSLQMDFERSHFTLEADWQYLISLNRNLEPEWKSYHSERVKFELNIYPLSFVPDLHQSETDGLVLPLEGLLKDGKAVSECSGLMVFDNVADKSEMSREDWVVSIYLYDFNTKSFEVKLKLPILIDRHNGLYN